MKKLLALILCLILCLSLFACNEETDLTEKPSESQTTKNESNGYDSVNVSAKEKEEIGVTTSDTVIKIYGSVYNENFTSGNNVFNCISKSDHVGYIIKNQDGDVTLKDGVLDDRFYRFALTPNKVFDDSVKVFNTFCFGQILMGCFVDEMIYFATNKGDYVLCESNYIGKEESEGYLIPIKDFQDMANDMRRTIRDGEFEAFGGPIGIYAVRTHEELSKYLIFYKQ